MKYKPENVSRETILCAYCKAEILKSDAVPQYVLRFCRSTTMVYGLALLCWFCTYPVDKPLPVSACLVPLNSTRQQIPEETRPEPLEAVDS